MPSDPVQLQIHNGKHSMDVCVCGGVGGGGSKSSSVCVLESLPPLPECM
jgi:hypothetical protein